MSKTKIAARLADEFGTTASKAKRFLDDVGPAKARSLLRASDDAGKAAGRFPWKTAAAGGAATGVGGGALFWREQDVREVEAMADKADSYNDAVGKIIDSDLPPEVKKSLSESAANAAGGDNSGGSDNGGGNDWLPFDFDVPNPFEDLPMMILGLVVVVIVLNIYLSPNGGGQ